MYSSLPRLLMDSQSSTGVPNTVETFHPWIIGFAIQELLLASLMWHECPAAPTEIIKRGKMLIGPLHTVTGHLCVAFSS